MSVAHTDTKFYLCHIFVTTKMPKRKYAPKKRAPVKTFSSTRFKGKQRRTLSTRRPPTRNFKPLRITPTSQLAYQGPSKYALSLIDPFNYKGVRIPDLACHPSAVYSLEFDDTVTLQFGATGGTVSQGIIIPLCGNAGAKFYANDGSTTVQTPFGNTQQIYQTYSLARIVSAQVIIKFAGNDADMSGSLVGCFFQASDNASGNLNSGQTMAVMLNQAATTANSAFTNLLTVGTKDAGTGAQPAFMKRRGAYMGPIADGLKLQFRPADADDFIYRGVTNGTSSTAATAGNATYNVPIYDINCGFMLGIVGGTVGASRQFTISVTINLEALPVDDSSGQQGIGTYVNPQAQAYGLNVAANCPACTSATATELNAQKTLVRSLSGGM